MRKGNNDNNDNDKQNISSVRKVYPAPRIYLLPATVPKLNDFLPWDFLARNFHIFQLVQRAEVDEEEGRLVMPTVKPEDAGRNIHIVIRCPSVIHCHHYIVNMCPSCR